MKHAAVHKHMRNRLPDFEVGILKIEQRKQLKRKTL